MPTFSTPEPVTADIWIPAGNIWVTAADRPDTVVDVQPSDPGQDHDVRGAEQTRVEEAAGRDGISVNAWLVRAATAAVTGGIPPAEPAERRPATSGQRFTGWVR
jgi:hypothetical protein